MLFLCLLRKRWLQSPQSSKLCFHHMVIFHAVSAILFEVHVAVQFADGLIVQLQRFLQALLTVAAGIYDALVVIQILQEF